MANAEHVALARQGAGAIARWRREHPEGRLDLRGANLNWADLSGADLGKSDLSGADLSGTDLSGADLSLANLSGADLRGANLRGANLRGPNLNWADLSGADLGKADLSGAHLSWANLSGADLGKADLSEAVFDGTVLANSNLAEVTGLEHIDHRGPITVDHRTIARSGELPLAFLRGVGLPDALIDFYRATYGKPIQLYSCFISYAHEDQQFAERLYTDLQARDVRCWKNDHNLKTGDRFREVIDRAIRLHDKTLLVLSEHSLASDWVESEVETALETERRTGRTMLFPVRLDDAVMDKAAPAWAAEIRRTRHIGDFRAWKEHDAYSAALARLLLDLEPEAG